MSGVILLVLYFLFSSVHTSPLHVSEGHVANTTMTDERTFANRKWTIRKEFLRQAPGKLQEIGGLKSNGIRHNLFSRLAYRSNAEVDTRTILNNFSTVRNSSDEGDGLNYDSCSLTDGCVAPRECGLIEGEDLVMCSENSKDCECIPVTDASCSTEDDCDNGEICEEINEDTIICISETAGRGDGLNYDSCTETDRCAGLRKCAQFEDMFVDCRFDEPICVCAPFKDPTCEIDDDCDDGETCEPIEVSVPNLCVSKESEFFESSQETPSAEEKPTLVPTPSTSPVSPTLSDEDPASDLEPTPSTSPVSPSLGDGDPASDLEPTPSTSPVSPSTGNEDSASDAVCVDAGALSHLEEHELVFDEHRLAVVLCDVFGSCATAGHMVVWYGKGMMMKRYCTEIGGCKTTKMHVNSPKWKRRMRVESKTDGLEYTAFAARYETKVEEMVLKTAVHVGL